MKKSKRGDKENQFYCLKCGKKIDRKENYCAECGMAFVLRSCYPHNVF